MFSFHWTGTVIYYYCLFLWDDILPPLPTCKSWLLQFSHCLGFDCCPEKCVSVLLDLLFQFITQAPFTLSPACCQSPWPVWEPATAVQSFTYWTMVRGGTSWMWASQSSSSALFILLTEKGGGVMAFTLDLGTGDGCVLPRACQLFLLCCECRYQPQTHFHILNPFFLWQVKGLWKK